MPGCERPGGGIHRSHEFGVHTEVCKHASVLTGTGLLTTAAPVRSAMARVIPSGTVLLMIVSGGLKSSM